MLLHNADINQNLDIAYILLDLICPNDIQKTNLRKIERPFLELGVAKKVVIPRSAQLE